MGQAKRREAEIKQIKANGPAKSVDGIKNVKGNFAINFKFHVAEEDEYRYNLLAVYSPTVIQQMRDCKYNSDKCFDIILQESQNLLVTKAGNADLSDTRQKAAVQQAIKNVACAVLRMTINDQYKEFMVGSPDIVLDMTLEEGDDGDVSFNPVGNGQSAFIAQRGVDKFVKEAPKSGVNFVIEL